MLYGYTDNVNFPIIAVFTCLNLLDNLYMVVASLLYLSIIAILQT